MELADVVGFRLGTAPLSNRIWLYIALNRTPNIDCYWGGGQYPRFRNQCLGFREFMAVSIIHHPTAWQVRH